MIFNKDYEETEFFFRCKKCHKTCRFEFVKKQIHNKIVLRCSNCNFLNSKKVKYLDEQIKKGLEKNG